MGQQNHLQPYTYSLRTIAMSDAGFCGYRAMLYMLPPKDALRIERLYCHFVMQFASGVAAANRKIESIGIVDEIPLLISQEANYQRRQELNIQADANRRVDVSIDLTHLLKKDNVAYEEGGFDPADDEGFTMVEVKLPDALDSNNPNYLNVGTVELWKIDGLFTTVGIR
jgi:hypothetical protein